MRKKKIDALLNGLTQKEEKDHADEDNGNNEGDGDTGEGAPEPAARLTNRQVTAGFVILAVLLLLFFTGMRWIDGRAKQLVPAEGVSETVPGKATPTEDKININTATPAELKTLHGIGDKKANAIVDYRNEYGRFTSVEEIKRVEGIGDGIFEAIKDDICV